MLFNDSLKCQTPAASMLVLGLGGAAFKLVGLATLSGTALAALVGITLNLVLPKE